MSHKPKEFARKGEIIFTFNIFWNSGKLPVKVDYYNFLFHVRYRAYFFIFSDPKISKIYIVFGVGALKSTSTKHLGDN